MSTVTNERHFGPARAFAIATTRETSGTGVLGNFVLTLDLSNAQILSRRARDFDDGRYRPIYESAPRGHKTAESKAQGRKGNRFLS